jgi:membrane protein DedA with SNARE-associated domain
LWTFHGSIVRCLFLGYLGWALGEPYQAMAKGIDKIEAIVSLLLLGSIFGLILWLRWRVRGKILESD